ncbi:conjugal transfer protein TraH [Geotalea uraniireducens]|uniref:Conjugal transfer protein TraH n=1 Tax=Geotalea uraniireducens TaxID=351604 RepID=A0ABN6VMZ0_9BACT|nr:conjugal transfer protein TraH [Geotalea uraniireducens]BDV41574.1 conjugal transfer protein TraH [Geotalea uraniireducens]
MLRRKRTKLIAAAVAVSLAGFPGSAPGSGWVDDWIKQKSSTSPSYYEGAKRGYYTGGGFSARWANSNDYLVTASLPQLKSGCGGIDAFLGGFSFMNVDYLVQKLQNILSAAPAAAFDIALKTLAPQVADTIKTLEAITDRLNSLQLNDCKAAKALVATASSPFSSIMSDSLKAEMKSAQTDFLVSSGAKDLAHDVSKLFDSELKSASGTKPMAPGTIQASAASATAGCPDEVRTVFGDGSVLENLAAKRGMSSDYVQLIRGFIGDVIVQSPATSGTTYRAQYIPPCDKNESFSSFIDGTAQRRASGGACADITDANKNLLTYVNGQMQAIAGKLKARQPLSADEETFLKSTPLSVGLILKNATATNTEGEVIGKLSEVTARAFGYYMLLDLFNRAVQLSESAKNIMSSQQTSKAGASPETCQIALLGEGLQHLQTLEEKTLHLLQEAHQSYANAATEVNSVEMLVLNMKRFDDTVFAELSGRFGTGVARRALGKS